MLSSFRGDCEKVGEEYKRIPYHKKPKAVDKRMFLDISLNVLVSMRMYDSVWEIEFGSDKFIDFVGRCDVVEVHGT